MQQRFESAWRVLGHLRKEKRFQQLKYESTCMSSLQILSVETSVKEETVTVMYSVIQTMILKCLMYFEIFPWSLALLFVCHWQYCFECLCLHFRVTNVQFSQLFPHQFRHWFQYEAPQWWTWKFELLQNRRFLWFYVRIVSYCIVLRYRKSVHNHNIRGLNKQK